MERPLGYSPISGDSRNPLRTSLSVSDNPERADISSGVSCATCTTPADSRPTEELSSNVVDRNGTTTRRIGRGLALVIGVYVLTSIIGYGMMASVVALWFRP